ncbi:MAG TPA: multiheme c-type cytochrome [Terriglobia bacterium]|nr:multiheme c-type cytochrome [Terriglobia bacterium]
MDQNGDSASPVRHAFLTEHGILGFGVVGGVLLFLTITGLWIWLLPFSVSAQMAVLLHTAFGLLLVIPLAFWQLSHWLATRKARWRFRKFCAYAGFWSIAVTTLSGIVVSWEAVFSLNISHFWDRTHLWSGLAAIPFLAVHVWPGAKTIVIHEDLHEPAGTPVNLSPGRRRMWVLAGGTTGALLVILGVVAAVYRAPEYTHYKLPAGYKMPYGKDPFAPSMTTTESGGPVAPELLAGSKSCGAAGCHTGIYQEWRASAHRWASEDIFFQAIQGAMIKEAGAPATRYCAGCHDPVSLLSAYKNASASIEAPGFKEGDSCIACHAMRRVDVQGNGNYVWGPPKPYLFEHRQAGYALAVAHFLIRAYPRQHDKDYDLALAKKPESCASCHKQFIDKQINHVGWVQLQNQYDDWRMGKWNTSPDPAHRLRCQQCHMYYVTASNPAMADPYDRLVGLGLKHRNHWFAAANQVIPETIHSPDAAAQTERVVQWLKGEKYIPEIASIWPKGPVIPIKVVAAEPFRPGSPAEFRVVLSNNKAGHSFPTGPLDLIRAWVEVKVSDSTGRVLFHSGELTAQGHVEPGTFVLKAVGVNPQGQEITRHDLWHYIGAQWKRAIFPGYSDMYEYKFNVPRNAPTPLTITARLRYRKANQYFMDFSFPGKRLETPITNLSSDRVEVSLAAGHGAKKAQTASAARSRGASSRRPGAGR